MVLKNRFLTPILLVFLTVFFGVSQLAARSYLPDSVSIKEDGENYWGLWINPRIVKRLLSINLAVADLVWIDVLLKADIEKVKEPFSKFFKASKAVVELDPNQIYTYYIAGLYLSVVKDDIKAATDILRDGAQHIERSSWAVENPSVWKVYFSLGYNLVFEELEIAEGSKWLAKAGSYENAPLYVKELSKKASTEQGRYEIASRVVADLYRRAQSPEVKKAIERKMLDLASKHEIYEVNEKFDIFLNTTGAYALPKEKAFKLFLRSFGNRKDLQGREFTLDKLGKITISN